MGTKVLEMKKCVKADLPISLQPGNLRVAVRPDGRSLISYISGSKLQVLFGESFVTSIETIKFSEEDNGSPEIFQHVWANDSSFCALACQRGFQVVIPDFRHHKCRVLMAQELLPQANVKGTATAIEVIGKTCFVGLSTGQIIAYKTHIEDGRSVRIKQFCYTDCAVSALVAKDDEIFAAAHIDGTIFWFSVKDGTLKGKVQTSVPASCLAICRLFLIAGSMDGKIKIFNLDSCSMTAEVNAHAYEVTCLDICEKTGSLLSCSEDCLIHMFRIGGSSDEEPISFVSSTMMEDCLLTGVRFLDAEGMMFASAAYDLTEVFVNQA